VDDAVDAPSVAELVAAFDAMRCPQCIAQRTEIEALLAGPPDLDVGLEALRRWQQHKDSAHPQLSAYLRRQDP
jgi:hypothetical protein